MNHQNFVERFLLEYLHSTEVTTAFHQDPNGGLRIGQGPSVLQVEEVDVWQHKTSESWLAHIEVSLAFNPEHSESIIHSCETGWGDSPKAALSFASDALSRTFLPPAFSLLYSKPVLDAAYFANSIPSWDSFSSPYVLKGGKASREQLFEYVQENMSLSAINNLVKDSLTKPMLNTIKLYIGFSGIEYQIEYRINNKRHEQIEQALLKMQLPELTSFASVSDFSLLMKN